MKYSIDPTSTASSSGIDGKKFAISLLAASILSTKSYQMDFSPLLHNGLMENITSSRPKRIPCEARSIPKRSTARALLKYAGTWVGDDLEQCLREVYTTRGEAKF